jgi:hypothetical protein
MFTTSILMMFLRARMVLYLRILVLLTRVTRLDRFGSFKKLDFSERSRRRLILSSTGFGAPRARTMLELKPNTIFHHAERTVI